MHPQSIYWKAVLTIHPSVLQSDWAWRDEPHVCPKYGHRVRSNVAETTGGVQHHHAHGLPEPDRGAHSQRVQWALPNQMKSPDGKEENTPISTIFSYSQMNKVTDWFLTTDWILAVPVNQNKMSQQITSLWKIKRICTSKVPCSSMQSVFWYCWNQENKKLCRYDQTDLIKKENV